MKKVLIIIASVAFLAGCNSTMGQKQFGGTLLGGIGGAVAGAQFGKGKGKLAAVAAGTLLGAFIGNEVGASLDNADRAAMGNAYNHAMENVQTGQQVSWNNPDSGNSGAIVPTKTYQAGATYCREFSQTINVSGKTEQAYGTACRQPDGSWKLQ